MLMVVAVLGSVGTCEVLGAASAPSITTQPTNQTVTLGSKATFTVKASGTGTLAYQWSRKGTTISGATSASYTTPATVATDSGATYSVKVTNSYGSTTSSNATLTVNQPPTISTQPLSQTVTLGSKVSFTVTANGTGTLTYQWSKNSTTISGATSASYTTPATVATDNGATFSVKVTNSYGSATSSNATLTVNLPPAISIQPANQTVTLGSTATFSVTASGTGTLTYQWYKNGTTISGATSASYTTPATVATDNGATFSVKVTNSYGSTSSSNATLTVNQPPTISTQPANQTVTLGSTATFSVTASGTGTLTYQWYKNGTTIPGATSASYTTPATVATDNGATFSVKATNSYGSTTSSNATLTVNQPPKISTQPANQTVTLGSTATFSVIASGTGTLAYQWSKNGTTISGATSASYTTPATVATDNGATFSVKVTNAYGSITSAAATLTVTSPITVTITPTTLSLTVGKGAKFGYTIANATNTSVTWSILESGGGTIDGSGNYVAPATTGTYTVQVASVQDPSRTAQARVTVVPAPDGTLTAPTSAAPGATGLTASVPLQTGATYAWTVTGGTATSGQSTNVLTFSAGTGSSLTLSCKVTNAAGDSVTSNLTIPIKTADSGIVVTVSPTSATLPPGGVQVFSATVTGTTNQSTQWTTTGGTLAQVSGGMQYTAPSKTGTYTVTVTSAADSTKTAKATVTVSGTASVAVSLSPSTAQVVTGGTQAFTATVTGTTNKAVTWTTTIGSVDTNGTFTAPAQGGTGTLTAQSVADTTKTASATILVYASSDLGKVLLTTPSPNMAGGDSITITASVIGSSKGVTWRPQAGSWSYTSTRCTYTAGYQGQPLSVGTYTLTATSVEYPDQSATLLINVFAPGTTVALTPAGAGIVPGGTAAFSALVLEQADQAVTWSVTGGGSIDAKGVYSAPNLETTAVVTATAVSNAAKTGTAQVGVSLPEHMGLITVTPPQATLRVGDVQIFKATVQGTGQGVSWYLDGGSVVSTPLQATYTAQTPGMYQGYAVSDIPDALPTWVPIQVYPAGAAFGVVPQTLSLLAGDQFPLALTFFGGASVPVTWQASAGTVDATGLFTAPTTLGTFTVTATSTQDTSQSATCTVTVHNNPVIDSFTATPLEVYEGQNVTLQWSVRNATDVQVQTTKGLPLQGQLVVQPDPVQDFVALTATNAQGQASAQVALRVVRPSITSFDVTPQQFTAGSTVVATAVFTNGTGRLKLRCLGAEQDLGPVQSGVPVALQPLDSASLVLEVTGAAGATRIQSRFLGRLDPGQYTLSPRGTFTTWNAERIHLDRDGMLLVDGGYNSQGTILVERFDPLAGLSLSTSPFTPSTSHVRQGSVLMADGTLLAIGGITYHVSFDDYIYTYNASGVAPQCDVSDPGLLGVYGHTMLSVPGNGIALYGGFRCPDGCTWCYDGVSVGSSDLSLWTPGKGWSKLHSQTDRTGGWSTASAALDDGRILMGGPQAEIFSTKDGTSQLLGTWPAGPMVALPDGRILVVGADELLWWDPGTGAVDRKPSCVGDFWIGSAHLLPNGKVALLDYLLSQCLTLDPVQLTAGLTPLSLPQTQANTRTAMSNTLAEGIQVPAGAAQLLPNGEIFCMSGTNGVAVVPTYTFRIQPSHVIQSPGQRLTFTVATGSADGVTWSASQGTVFPDGTFECLDSGSILVKAVSSSGEISYARVDQPYAALQAEAWVTSTGAYSRAANPYLLAAGGTTPPLAAMLRNHPDQRFTWSILEGTDGGSLANGVYTAPATPGTYHVVATSLFDSRYTAQITMEVATPLVVDPMTARVQPSGTIRIWALPAGNTQPLTWTSSGGSAVTLANTTINPSTQTYVDPYTYQWTAPPVPGTYTLTASCGNLLGQTQTVVVTVVSGAEAAIFVAPSLVYARPGVGFMWQVSGTVAVDPQGNQSGIGKLQGTLVGPLESPASSSVDLGLLDYVGYFTMPMVPGSYSLILTQVQAPWLSTTSTLHVQDSPAIQTFKVDPLLVMDGQTYTLSWAGVNADQVRLDGQTQGGLVGSATRVGGNWGTSMMGENYVKTHTLAFVKRSTPLGTPSADSRSLTVIRGKEVLQGPSAGQATYPGGTLQIPLTLTLLAGVNTDIGMLGSLYKLKLDVTWTATGGTILQTSSSLPVSKQVGNAASSYTVTPWVQWQAPMQVGTFSLTATCKDDSTVICTIPVTVSGTGVFIGIAPAAANVYTGGTAQFTASLLAPTCQVVWSSTIGTITSTGLFLAPSVPGTGTVTVTSVDDPTKSASATVSVTVSPVSIAITPLAVGLYAGQNQKFGYSLAAPTQRIVWSCTGGTVSQDGLFAAPATAGTCQVTITSVDDPAKSATATVTVRDVGLALNPASATLDPGQPLQLGCTYDGPDGSTLTWSATGGTVTQQGLYTAPAATGSYTISLVSSAEPSLVQRCVVTVTTPVMQVLPANATTNLGGTVAFQALSRSGSATWSVVETGGGTISASGLYTAPLKTGTFTVKAISSVDATQYGLAKVTVITGSGGGSAGDPVTGLPGTTGAQVTLMPGSLQADAGSYYPFAASVSVVSDSSVTWSVTDATTAAAPTGGVTLDPQGVFQATRHGTFLVQATSVADPTATASATVIVGSAIHPANSPLSNLRGYTVTTLDNGTLLLAGGTPLPADFDPATTVYSAKAWIYDPTSRTYTPTADLLTARCDHHAVKLQDGRVLIAGGYARWVDPWFPPAGASSDSNTTPYGHPYPFAEIYDPAAGTFTALPNRTIGPFPFPENLYFPGTFGGPGLMCDSHDLSSQALLLPNGKAWFSGGIWGWANRLRSGLWDATKGEGTELFDPTNGQFSPAADLAGDMEWTIHSHHAVTPLADGRIFITRGLILGEAGPNGWPAQAGHNASIFDGTLNTLTDLDSVLQVGRLDASATLLPNGHVLVVGGATGKPTVYGDTTYPDGGTYNYKGDFMYDFHDFGDTATAEEFDPVSGTSALVGSLTQARRNHAAVLLPTGQVLIVGGTVANGDGTFSFPNQVELYDPDSRTFSVMDKLDYGLSEPKAVLLNDGSVFLAGQVQAPMEPPPSQSKSNGLRMMAANASGVTALTTGMSIFGHTTSFAPIAGPMFMNQGVDRMVADVNDKRWDGTATPGQAWRSSVPRIAGRDTLIHGTFISPLPLAASKAKQLRYDVYLNGSTKAGLTDLPLATQDSSGFWFWAKENQWGYTFVVDGATATKDATLQVKLKDQTGTILASGSWQQKDLQTDVMKPWTDTAAPMTVKLVRVKYIYMDGNTRKVEWVGKTDPNEFTAATSAAEACIKSYYPVATGPTIVAPQNEVFFICSEDYKDENGNPMTNLGQGTYWDPAYGNVTPFNLTQSNQAWGDVLTFAAEWASQATSPVGISGQKPANTFVAFLVPRIAGHTYLVNGGNARGVGTSGSHFVLYLYSEGVFPGGLPNLSVGC